MIDLRAKDRLILCQLAQQIFTQGTKIWAYGSRVKGTNHDASDLDLVVHFDSTSSDNESFEQLVNFKEALQESTIPIFVQVFAWSQIPESFKSNIEENYQVLFSVE
ncbi:MAG: nucleotidyltransferase domain-containing protein [Pseudomonadales bacterium]